MQQLTPYAAFIKRLRCRRCGSALGGYAQACATAKAFLRGRSLILGERGRLFALHTVQLQSYLSDLTEHQDQLMGASAWTRIGPTN